MRLAARAALLRAIEPQRAGDDARVQPAIGADQHIVERAHARAQLDVLEGARDARARDAELALRTRIARR